MNLTKKFEISIGVSAGANMFQANLNTLNLDQGSDPAFQTNVNNKVTPNFGLWCILFQRTFFMLVFLLRIWYRTVIPVTNPENVTTLISKEQRHYFLIAGTLINLSSNLALNLPCLLKWHLLLLWKADVTASFIIIKKLLLGAMVRTGDAVGGLVDWT